VSVDSNAHNYFVNENYMKQDGTGLHIGSKSFAVPPSDCDLDSNYAAASSATKNDRSNTGALASISMNETIRYPFFILPKTVQVLPSKEQTNITSISNHSETQSQNMDVSSSLHTSVLKQEPAGFSAPESKVFPLEESADAIVSDGDSICSFTADIKEEFCSNDDEESLTSNNDSSAAQEDSTETRTFYTGNDFAGSRNDDGKIKMESQVSDSSLSNVTIHKRYPNKTESEKSKKATKSAISTFKSWLASRKETVNFETWDEAKLNKILESFYSEVKKQTGTDFSRASLISLRCGINRHLNNPPFERDINIMNSPKFASSNKIFFSVLKQKRQRTEKVLKPITPEDLKKIKDTKAFNINDPLQLQQKVFFDIVYKFRLGGRDIVRSLKKSSFVFKMDDYNREYCVLSSDVPTKDIPISADVKKVLIEKVFSKTVIVNDSQTKLKPRLHATGHPDCPLFSLKKYLSKLNPDPKFSTFFVQHRSGRRFDPAQEKIWYSIKPLGINSIARVMKNISHRLHLSYSYTNGSIRKTQLVCELELG